MIERRMQIRSSIIPDSSVKLLALCLSEEDNEIFMATTQRKAKDLEFRSDWALQSVINERIKNSEPKILPLVLRKRELCKTYKSSTPPRETLKLEELFEVGKAPIMMRKFLLYQQTRAG